jgi:hypothetical protein
VIKINLNTEIPVEIEIIEDYWKIDEQLGYVYPANEIAKKFGITVPKITGLVSTKSSLTLTCIKCENEIGEYQKRTDFSLQDFQNLGEIICENCIGEKRKEEIKKDSIENKEEVLAAMDVAFQTEAWKLLDIMELETLIIVAESKDKKEIYDKLFKGADVNGDYAKSIWNRLNRLHEKKLIWVERTEDRKIVDIHIKGELVERLRVDYSYFFMPAEPEKVVLENLQFTLRKNLRKLNDKQPEFSGIMSFDKEVLLGKDVEYQYGAWINNDGTIFLRIVPQLRNTRIEDGFGFDTPTFDLEREENEEE